MQPPKTFKKPDLNAPRFRPSRYNVANPGMIRRFKKEFPKYSTYSDQYIREVIETFNSSLSSTVIDLRDGVELPQRLGHIFIGTCQPIKKFAPDHGYFGKTGVLSRHKNFESDNYLAKIFYTNFDNAYSFQNKGMWWFEGTRNFKRAVSKAYPTKWKMYLEVDNYKYISRIFNLRKKSAIIKKLSKRPVSEDYNEFNID